MKRINSLLAFLFATCMLMAQKYKLNMDIPYTTSDDAYETEHSKLDFYYLEGGKDFPVVACFHGDNVKQIYVSGHSAGNYLTGRKDTIEKSHLTAKIRNHSASP